MSTQKSNALKGPCPCPRCTFVASATTHMYMTQALADHLIAVHSTADVPTAPHRDV